MNLAANQNPASASLAQSMDRYVPTDNAEEGDLKRIASLLKSADDPWSRTTKMHITASAIVVHPPTRTVLLRWHSRLGDWIQVGGHGDLGESNPVDVALREANEETALSDLHNYPDTREPVPIQIVVLPVPANESEPAHEHADFRFLLATAIPNSACPENPDSPIKWVPIGQAIDEAAEESLRTALARALRILEGNSNAN